MNPSISNSHDQGKRKTVRNSGCSKNPGEVVRVRNNEEFEISELKLTGSNGTSVATLRVSITPSSNLFFCISGQVWGCGGQELKDKQQKQQQWEQKQAEKLQKVISLLLGWIKLIQEERDFGLKFSVRFSVHLCSSSDVD